MKRIGSMMVTLILLLSAVLTAHAAGGNFAGGDGSPDNPYRIADGFDLLAFSNIVNGGRSDACAVLVNDIDMQNTGSSPSYIPPIGYKNNQNDEIAFEGTFDGQWHIIKNFRIDMSSLPHDIACGVGLFGIVKGVVKNVGVVDCNINVDKHEVGGVAGINRGTIDNCYFTGNVFGNGDVGGVVGHNMAGGIVKRCYNTGKIVASSGCNNVGGVAGVNEGTVKMCFNTGRVGDGNSGNNVGGIVGKLAGVSPSEAEYQVIIQDCYNRDLQTGYTTEPQITGSSNVGGIVGLVEGNSSDQYLVRNCYNTGIVSATNNNSGGIIGNAATAGSGTPTADVVSCYFSEGTPNILSGGTEYQKTCDQLRDPDTFDNWDLNGTWRFICKYGDEAYPPMLRLMFLDREEIKPYIGSREIDLAYNGEITCIDAGDTHTIAVPYQVSLENSEFFDDVEELYTIEISYIIADKAYTERNVTFKKYRPADGDLKIFGLKTATGTARIHLMGFLPEDPEQYEDNVLPGQFDETTDGIYLVAEYMDQGNTVRYSSKPLLVYPFSAVTTPPAAKTGLTYNGTAQALVTPGTASGGTMYYALGANDTDAPTSGWAESVPTGTDAGTYYVWYKVVGNSTHLDSEIGSLTAEIQKRSVTVRAKNQTVDEDAAIDSSTAQATLTGAVGGHALSAVTLTADMNAKTITPSDARIKDGAGKDVTGNYVITYQPGTVTVNPVSYSVVSGDGQQWQSGSGAPLSFTFKRSINDQKTFGLFQSASVDGAALGPQDGEIAEGSLILTLSDRKADSLPVGDHTLTVVFTDGTAQAGFTVLEAEPLPKTGDDAPLLLWAACLSAGALLLLAAGRGRKKRSNGSRE